jgi:methionyl-tRNA formyltransferase
MISALTALRSIAADIWENRMRIVFMGTPDFAVPCLEALIKNGYEVAGVVTQPDKPVGRRQSGLQPPPVKRCALEHGVPVVLQPEKVKTQEFADAIRALAPDLIITAAYGRIITRAVLDIPPLGCINVHGSLLPRYRGAAPMQWAIINGESVTGITTMFMDEGMDTGDMLLKREVAIPPDMTYAELYEKLKALGPEVLLETLRELEAGTLKRVPQNHAEATTVSMMKRDMGLIDWSKSAVEIHNLVRGTDPWPGAFTYYKGGRLKIWKTRLFAAGDPLAAEIKASAGDRPAPGRICRISGDSLAVAAGSGLLKILEVQFESGRRMTVRECGHNMDEGEVLG